MRRAQHPSAKAAAAVKYLPLPADPLNPIAEQVGKEVAAKVKRIARRVPGTGGEAGKKAGNRAHMVVLVDWGTVDLEAHITGLVAKALDRSLTLRTAEGKALRMALIARLANVEMGEATAVESQPAAAQAPGADGLLTTAQAAAKLEVSRPHVSMLCDQGKLGEVVMTDGGHRRVRASAVETYLNTRTKQIAGAESPREAGVNAGLYDFPDGHFKNAVRGHPDAGGRVKVPPKAARKPRS
jgi:excisionase family DNA binding protein